MDGRLDATTAREFEAEVKRIPPSIRKLVLDMSSLQYLSSAGLRVLLAAHTKMEKQGEMSIRRVPNAVMDIFRTTGFLDILSVEKDA